MNRTELKYRILTYGCQMNEYDSEVIASVLDNMGGAPVETDDEADIIILNTCCVRKTADNKVYGRLGQYKQLKDQKPDCMIIVAGCLAQKDKEGLAKKYPHIDLVLGTHNLRELPQLIEEIRGKGPVVRTDDQGAAFLSPSVRKGTTSAYIPISIGCDCFCTYCIVPYVRGRLQSRPVEEILIEAEKLAAQGFMEIFLLGQNVNSYGFDLPGQPRFWELLEKLDAIKGVSRIRFTSPHPKDFPPELVKAVAELPSVCECIHLPLQAGSNRVLKLMNRRYTREQYLDIIEDLRARIPGVALSTDLIVGFPGETEEDFEEGLEFIRKIEFDQAFMFAYSLRDGTAAEKMPGHLEQDVKMGRLYKLIDMQNDISRKLNIAQEGKTVECLVEAVSKKDPGKVTGRTRTNRVVNFAGSEDLIGKLVNVKLIKGFTWGLTGEMCI
ncbi:MAG: tRNA (N6-isopentenyl adenosine(37)-C2)-methylthiotransferase MiaB [Firmicutes bacterium]|nr:tRNA (N6-isopentenyl adenosine(37)-C2)-methylthiotransferase MiaB [Bacillota bacterium]